MPTEQDGRGMTEADEVRKRARKVHSISSAWKEFDTVAFAISERALATRETLEKCLEMARTESDIEAAIMCALEEWRSAALRRELAEMGEQK